MENNLTEDQISRLQEISQLPKEKQQAYVQEFLKSLSPEQRKSLEKQQTGCIFCNLIKDNSNAFVVYEDNFFMAILDIYPATLGHIILFPKEHISDFSQLTDTNLFLIMKKITSRLKDDLKIPGYNIFVAEGKLAGQNLDHLLIHIIPRYENDGLQLGWQPQKADEKDLKQIHKKLRLDPVPIKKEVIPSQVELIPSKKSTKKVKGRSVRVRKKQRVP